MTLNVHNVTIESREEVLPPYMVASGVVFCFEVCQCRVACDHCEFLTTCELINPLGQSLQHAECLQFITKVAALGGSEFLRHECCRPGQLPVLALGKNSANPSRTGIHDNPHIIIVSIIWCNPRGDVPSDWFQDGCFTHNHFYLIETFLV